ncbi:hypothetical protein [Streptomyces sp. ISL-96]|uniref:hypothetical protein n=1 Tax=Streptomyces sp. ISL-96 TaxID=2819191 RepID=UPI0035AB8020
MHFIDQPRAQELLNGRGASAEPHILPVRRFEGRRTVSGPPSVKLKVVPPSMASDGRGWWVRTKTPW